jgi:hypothetical protein
MQVHTPVWKRTQFSSTLVRYRSAIATHLRRHWFFNLVQFGAVAWAVVWWRHLPVPGYAIGVLALLAAVMSVHIEAGMLRWQKAFWMLLMGAFLVIEFRAINKDRSDYAKVEEDKRKVERDSFQRIADGITKAINDSDTNFSITMAKEDVVLDTTKKVADLSAKNLASISGQDSFPCIVPQSHAASNTTIPLFIWNKGKNNLTGVELRILSIQEFISSAIFFKPPVELGTLPPTWGKPLPEAISPTLGPDGTAIYQIEIWDQTGFYTEIVHFRRGKYALPWAYKYWLTKHVIINTNTTQSRLVKGCSASEWSDDLGDGKPATEPPS